MSRVIDWVEETRQALTRKQNHVNLTVDDLLAWEALPHILNRITALTDVLRELATSGVEFDDPRLSYVTLQVHKQDLAAALELLESK